MQVIAKPELVENPQFTVDIEVSGSHTYQVVTDSGARIISHNSVSLLGGVNPGIHWPISRCYIRRVRLMSESELLPALKEAGFHIEPCIGNEKTTVVVEFPIKLEDNIRTQEQVSIWEKVSLAAFIQKHWADNQVSVTVDFDPETEGDSIKHVLDYFQYQLKAISFLPRFKSSTPYPQMPYEPISEEKYNEIIKNIKPLNFDTIQKSKDQEIEIDMFCDTDTCSIGLKK